MSTLNRNGVFKPSAKSGVLKRSSPLPTPGTASGTEIAKGTETQMASGSLCICVHCVHRSPGLSHVSWGFLSRQ